MSSFTKKFRRKEEKEAKKKLQKKLGLFNKLSDQCLGCHKDFDKKNKEMAMTWSVIVRKDAVKLYCPDCWERVKNVVKEMSDG